ncbi:IclR family transcriptional regulator [Cupriavidus basilensis]
MARDRICIDAVSTDASPLRAVVQAGEQIPLLTGSGSKVLMAYMSKDDAAPLVTAVAKATKRTKADVLAEFEKVREQGYSVSHGERLLGISAISAPIKDVHEEVHYCLSLGAPTVRLQTREKELVKQVVNAAANISLQFGGKLE